MRRKSRLGTIRSTPLVLKLSTVVCASDVTVSTDVPEKPASATTLSPLDFMYGTSTPSVSALSSGVSECSTPILVAGVAVPLCTIQSTQFLAVRSLFMTVWRTQPRSRLYRLSADDRFDVSSGVCLAARHSSPSLPNPALASVAKTWKSSACCTQATWVSLGTNGENRVIFRASLRPLIPPCWFTSSMNGWATSSVRFPL